MQRSCDSCGKPYEARRKTSRFCSDTCRMRNQRAPKSREPVSPKPSGTDLQSVTERELAAVGRLETVLGQQAIELAGRISSSHETGAAIASLSKEFRAVMEAAMEGVGVAADPLDELRARRERKRSTAG